MIKCAYTKKDFKMHCGVQKEESNPLEVAYFLREAPWVQGTPSQLYDSMETLFETDISCYNLSHV